MAERITMGDVHNLLNERFDKFEEKFDKRMNKLDTAFVERVSKVEIRTDSLETFRDTLQGKIAIISAAISIAATILVGLAKDIFASK